MTPEEIAAKAAKGATSNAEVTNVDKPKAEGDKTVLEPKPAVDANKAVAPVEIKLALPKDSMLPESRVGEIMAEAKKNGWSQEQAERVLAGESEAVSRYHKSIADSFEATRASWVDSLKKDPEFGGEKLAETVELSKRAITKFATPGFIKALVDLGLGDNDDVIKTFAKIGKADREDIHIPATSGDASGGETPSLGKALYGKSTTT